MKKLIIKQLRMLCLLLTLTAIYKPVRAQQNPPNDSVGMGWMYEMYSGGGNFLDIKDEAERFFAAHPEYDTLAEFKNPYLDWLDYWRDRIHWADSATRPGDMASAQKAMSKIYTETTISNANLPYQPSWLLKSPLEIPTQNMGIITCTWINPNNNQNILVGTEASGLWETINGGSTWSNLTESYLQNVNPNPPLNVNQIPIGFGVSSICVMSANAGNRIIVISTYVPGTSLIIGHGLGLLCSPNIGNTVWRKFDVPSEIFDNIVGLENMNWKIIAHPENPSQGINNYIYSSYGERIYRIRFNDFGNLPVATKIFDLHDNIGSVNYHKQDDYQKTQKVREMEIVNNRLVITTDGFYEKSNLYSNALIFSAQLSDLFAITTYTNNSSWQNIDITPIPNYNHFIDYIAIDEFQNNLFAAYDIIELNANGDITDNEIFHYDKFITSGTVWLKDQSISGVTPIHNSNYELGYELAGFGYRFNAFEVISETRFYIGGFQLNACLSSNNTIVVDLLPVQGLPNTNAAHNNEYHYGIRDFGLDLSTGTLYLATEGGISKYLGGVFTNINGKGLVIGQVSNMTSTHNNKYDIIVHSSFRNGLWRYKCEKWDNFYWEDGGSLLLDEIDRDLNDNGEPDFIHNATSHINWNFPLFPYTNPYHYYTFIDCLGPPFLIPTYNITNTKYQNLLIPGSPSTEYNGNTPFEFGNPTNSILYQGLHNIYQSLDYGASWTNLTSNNNGYPSENKWSGNLEVIKVAPSNPDIMYIAFSSPTLDLNQDGGSSGIKVPSNKILRGDNTGGIWSWKDITPGINLLTPVDPGYILKWSGITDIAINPNDPDKIWITLNNFEGIDALNGRYRVLKGEYNSATSNCVFNDYSLDLTSAPVNCIVYNKMNNNDELFVGTDAGVFYINNSLNNHWQLFHTNNPKWIVRDLEINYNNMMLRAAIWGRGIWETPIKCSIIPPDPQTISGIKIWDIPVINCGNVEILTGANLTINADVEMAENTSITVHRGGKLIINNATIKSYCQAMWGGIIVDGDNLLNQTNWPNQAKVELNNCTIEDAYIALQFKDLNVNVVGSSAFSNIHRGSGGSVSANNATFRNNYCSVLMYRYSYMSNNSFHNNISYFKNCKFILDHPLKRKNNVFFDLKNDEQAAFVRIYNINGLSFWGCKFLNENNVCSNGEPYLMKGIYALKSMFYVDDACSCTNQQQGTPCPPNDIILSKFYNLKYGVYTIGNFDNFRSFSVKHTLFDFNKYGIYASNCENFYMISNTFNIPFFNTNLSLNNPNPAKPFYGAYLDGCYKNYHLEDNQFGEGNMIEGFIGLYVNNSAEPLKTIYNNRFTFLTYGFIARGDNGPNDLCNDNVGLKIKCNDFSEGFFNISVINDPLVVNNGINITQGRPFTGQSNYSVSDPAGNAFYGFSTHDFYNGSSNIQYVSHSESFTKPVFSGIAISQLNPTNISFNKASACPDIDKEPIGVGIVPDLPNLYEGLNTAQQELNSAKLIYRIWVDGGNTEALRNAVNLALPYEAYDLYNTLISSSPLSDEVLISAIRNEEVLPPLMLKMVLLANPQTYRSRRVMDALYARVNKFPESWIEELKLFGEGVISAREQLEAEIDHAAVNRQTIFNSIVSVYAADTVDEYTADSLIALYQRENTLETDIDLLYYYISHNMLYEASLLRELIPEKYTIDENMQLYWNNTYTITRMLTSLKSANKDIEEMDMEDRNQLYAILENPTTKATGIACMLLMQSDTNFVYEEPVDLPPDISENKSTKPSVIKQQTLEKLEVYPNPATDFVTLTYQTNVSLSGLHLIICDAMGKTVYSKVLTKLSDYLLIVLKDYAKGNYIASIINKNKTIKSCKFVVQ